MAGADWEGELARLRERAYGRDADILRDADARARLEELERRQVDASRVVDTPGIGGPDPAGANDVDADVSTAAPMPERAGSTPVRSRRRLALWWIASLVAAAALGAVAATAVVEATGAPEAVLHPTAGPNVGSAFDPTDVQSIRYYESFVGIHVASGVIARRPCLTVWTGATAPAAALHCGTLAVSAQRGSRARRRPR